MCLLVCCHFIPDFFFLLVGLTDSWHRTLSCRCVHVLFCCWCWSWCCCWCEFNYRQLRELERLELELLLSLLFLTTTLPPPPQITMSMSCCWCCSWHTTSTLCCKLTRQTRLTEALSFVCPLSVANVVVHFVAGRGRSNWSPVLLPFPHYLSCNLLLMLMLINGACLPAPLWSPLFSPHHLPASTNRAHFHRL